MEGSGRMVRSRERGEMEVSGREGRVMCGVLVITPPRVIWLVYTHSALGRKDGVL